MGVGRLPVAARAFSIAAILGLSLALHNPVSLQATILLAAISASAAAADLTSRLPQSWIALVEGALAGLVIAFALPDGLILLPYLVLPAFIAGVTAGIWSVIAVVTAEAVATGGQLMISGGFAGFSDQVGNVAPWLITAAGVGALGAWSRQVRYPGGLESDANYESARRLLSQLRTVARRLSSGLDTVSMCSHLLVTVHQHLSDTHSAVFIRTEGGVLAPLGYRGIGAKESLSPEGPVVDACWAEME
ncbi:MAG: hypothetical protein QM655_08515, partial [Nocardioidaceae bacterium]